MIARLPSGVPSWLPFVLGEEWPGHGVCLPLLECVVVQELQCAARASAELDVAYLPLRWVYRNRSAPAARSQPRNRPRRCRSLLDRLPRISAGTVILAKAGPSPRDH